MNTLLECKLRTSLAGLVLFLHMLSPGAGLFAQWSKDASRNNTIATLDISSQQKAVIASDRQNGAIILWEDTRNGSVDVYGQHILESGEFGWTPNGIEIAVGDSMQQAPGIAVTDTGTFFVAWLDENNIVSDIHVLLQAFRSNDAGKIWNAARVVHQGDNSPPRVMLSGSGEIITATYLSARFDDVISFQITDATGQPRFFPEQAVANDSAKGRQPRIQPAVTTALNGGVMAAWTDSRADSAIYVTGIHPNGTKWTEGDKRLSESAAFATYPVITSDGQAGALIAWIQPVPGAEDDMVRVTRIDETGNPVWTIQVVELTTTTGRKKNLQIASDNRNGAYLVWTNLSNPNAKLYAQRIKVDGEAWSSDVALSNAVGAQLSANVSNNGGGDLLCAWQDDRHGEPDIVAQAVDSTGALIWNADGVEVSIAAGVQAQPVLTNDGLGGAIITWQDERNITRDIYAQRVSITGELGEFRRVAISNPTTVSEWEIGSAQTIQWQASAEIESVRIELSRDGGQFFEVLLDGLDNINPAGNQATVQIVSGPPSEQCVLRISATRTPFIKNTSQTFKITNTTGPLISHDAVTTADAGEELNITAGVLDQSGVQDVSLAYIVGGKNTFISTNMSEGDASIYTGVISAESVTERGLRYFIKATDTIGAITYSDTFDVAVRFTAGTLTKQIALGAEQSAYRMISAPNALAQPLVDSVFTISNFGVYDTTSWRLFEYRNETNVERDSATAASFLFNPGQAYWLISGSTREVNFGRGASVPTGSTFPITLSPGWNQIGNPFTFAVAWEDIAAANASAIISRPSLFRGSYIIPNVIDPFAGYFLFNFGDQDITLHIPAKEFVDLGKSVAKNTDGLQWEIQVKAYCEGAMDEYNFVGIHDNAAAAWDLNDQPEPPPIGAFVSLYFPQKDWERFANNYTTDYRGQLDRGQTWAFEVRNNIANSEARVEIAPEALPANLKITLLDENLNVSQDLRDNPVYTFPTGTSVATKTLKLVIGQPEYVSEVLAKAGVVPTQFELAQNFPNPFNPTTSLRYALPNNEKVTLRIFDVLGREILKLVDGVEQKAGFHIVNWNGRNKAGLPVASGLYVYHITAGKFSQARKMLLVK